MKKKVIGYTHFHWDREWYKEYERFRFRLLQCFEIVLNELKSDKLPSFYFDGQTSALLDYLEIYPDKKDLIKSLVKDKRLYIGPFYCLVDEFLTSKPAFEKNLEIGLRTAEEFGCTEFLAYFADTFGHSSCTIPTLKKYNIDKAIVWRGCGDVPAEFTWSHNSESLKTVNLIRGYFHDIFAAPLAMDKKIEYLQTNLDKIAEKSGETLLLPIGADHLSIPIDLNKQIAEINSQLDNYTIELGSPFDYFKAVNDRFEQYTHEGELRDNSKTFILEGCYSARLDLKRLNIIATHKLEIANSIVKTSSAHKRFENLINYAFKLLLQNQAHDSICGCSTDDVHKENVVRYKKIMQIADSIIADCRLGYDSLPSFRGSGATEESLKVANVRQNNHLTPSPSPSREGEITLDDNVVHSVLNLSDKEYSGVLSFESEKAYDFPIMDTKNAFPADIFNDIYKIPITEDYTSINTYSINCCSQKPGLSQLMINPQADVFVDKSSIGNSKIFAQIKSGKLYVGAYEVRMLDFVDLGDSYNFGPKQDDLGTEYKVDGSEILMNNPLCSRLKITFSKDINSGSKFIDVVATLFADDDKIKFDVDWVNTEKDHLLQFCINTNNPVRSTLSEDLNKVIERSFEPDYDVRTNLPEARGQEVMMNNAPMQRGVCANRVCVVTQGITQYEVFGNELRLPLLRATGVISNPNNTARTTPAGPPIETTDSQMLGHNTQCLWIGLDNDLGEMIDSVYHKCVVL